MPIDLTADGRIASLTAALRKVTEERDKALATHHDTAALYDEIRDRDDRIERQDAKIVRLEARGITDLQHANAVYGNALKEIKEKKGRGATRIATEALATA